MNLPDRIASILALLAGGVLLAVIAVTFTDVILRYFFSSPLRGRQDIVEMGMVVALMLASPYTWRTAGHISVDLYNALPLRWLEIARALMVRIVVAVIFLCLAWRAWIAADDAALFNEATNMIALPHRPFIFVIMAISLLHCVVILIEIAVEIVKMIRSAQERKRPNKVNSVT